MPQPGCCCEESNCLPKFVITQLPRCGFPPLRLKSGVTGSYRHFGTKTITYTSEGGQSYSVTITINHRTGECDWTESSNLDSTQRSTMFTRITNRLNEVSFSEDELLSASGSWTIGEDYDWAISVSDEFDPADDLTDLDELLDTALAALPGFDENTLTLFGIDTYGDTGGYREDVAGVTDVDNLTGYTTPIDETPGVLFQYDAAGYYGAAFSWWQTDLTGNPTDEEEFDPGEYSCTYEDRGLGVTNAPDTALAYLSQFIAQISGAMCATWEERSTTAWPSYSTSAIGDTCTNGTGYVVSPPPEFVAINDVRIFQGGELTSPGYLTAGDCPCTNAP